MNWQGERWTAEQVLALAPDAASQKAGGKLATPARWSGSGGRDGALWGLCAGSGSKPYQTVVDLSGPAYRCSCPSRKFPCKHALGLLLLWATGEPVQDAEPPSWAEEWLTARRKRAEAPGAGARGAGGADKAGRDEGAAGDEAAARRRADRAEQRERRITGGATELQQRLADLVRDGLAGADRSGYAQWEETAARMVDAQAPGLASRVRELGAIPASGVDWPSRLLEECALLHLLGQGFLRIADLPAPLAATTRTRVGLTIDAAELLANTEPVRDHWLVLARQDTDDGKLTTRRVWLRGTRTGLMALLLSFGAAGRAPELAFPVGLVLDADLAFYPAARPLRAALGTRYGTVGGEGAAPRPDGPDRADTAGAARPAPAPRVAAATASTGGQRPAPEQHATPEEHTAPEQETAPHAPPSTGGAPGTPPPTGGASGAPPTRAPGRPAGAAVAPPGVDVSTALTIYGDALRDDPWLDAWPVVLSQVVPVPAPAAVAALATSTAPSGDGHQRVGGAGGSPGSADPVRAGDDGWQLADAAGGLALPVDPRCTTDLWQLAAISGGAPLTVFGECGHRGFVPLTAWGDTPVPLAPGNRRAAV